MLFLVQSVYMTLTNENISNFLDYRGGLLRRRCPRATPWGSSVFNLVTKSGRKKGAADDHILLWLIHYLSKCHREFRRKKENGETSDRPQGVGWGLLHVVELKSHELKSLSSTHKPTYSHGVWRGDSTAWEEKVVHTRSLACPNCVLYNVMISDAVRSLTFWQEW